MKRVALACLFFAAASAFAQSSTPARPQIPFTQPKPFQLIQPADNAGCPVVFTDIALHRNGGMMRVVQQDTPDGNLAFAFQNKSGKQIRSIAVRVEVKVKSSMYDLDTHTIALDMTLSGNSPKAMLPLTVMAYSVSRATLQQVTFDDGKTWLAPVKNSCSYQRPESIIELGSLK